MSVYLKKNIIPLGIEIIFIISCFIVPRDYYIYTNFVFYLLLLIYFIAVKDFSIKEWGSNLKKGKTFWKSVWVTAFFFMLAFVITTILENAFPHLDTGTIGLRRSNGFELFLFALSTIILPPIVEETFFRKGLIALENNAIMTITLVFSMFLYAAEHALSLWGIFLTMIWAFPLSISFIKTKNVYIPMTAHFIINLIGNGSEILFTIATMLQ